MTTNWNYHIIKILNDNIINGGHFRACTQTFEKGDANFRYLSQRVLILKPDFKAKIRGIKLVSGEKLHSVKVICPARGLWILLVSLSILFSWPNFQQRLIQFEATWMLWMHFLHIWTEDESWAEGKKKNNLKIKIGHYLLSIQAEWLCPVAMVTTCSFTRGLTKVKLYLQGMS